MKLPSSNSNHWTRTSVTFFLTATGDSCPPFNSSSKSMFNISSPFQFIEPNAHFFYCTIIIATTSKPLAFSGFCTKHMDGLLAHNGRAGIPAYNGLYYRWFLRYPIRLCSQLEWDSPSNRNHRIFSAQLKYQQLGAWTDVRPPRVYFVLIFAC